MDVINSILASEIVSLILKALLVLVILVTIDLILGILAAIKQKEFKWDRVGEFYRTKVIPELGGWLLFVVAARASLNAVVPNVDDQIYNTLFTGAAGIAWLAVIRDLLYSVSQNFCTVFGIPLLKPPAA